jgi:hypothetical protein
MGNFPRALAAVVEGEPLAHALDDAGSVWPGQIVAGSH